MGIVIRKTISTSIINYLGVLLGVINVLWLQTAIISELQVGILNYIFDVSVLLFPFILFGTSGLPARFLHVFKQGKEQNSFISLLFLVPFCILIFFSIVVLIFKDSIIATLGEDAVKYSNYLVYVLPILFCYVYQYLIEAILATKSLTVFSSFLKNIYRRLTLIGLLIIYSFQIIDFYHLVFWYVLAHFIEVVILFFFFKSQIDFKLSVPKLLTTKAKRKEIYIYALVLIIGVLGPVLVGKIDSVMISGITDDFKLLGVYSIAFFIATVIELPKRIVQQLAFPIMAKLVTDKKQDELDKMFKQTSVNMAIIGLFLFLIIWYNIDELFLIIPNGEIYSAGKWVVFFVGIAKVLDVVFSATDLMINATKFFRWNAILAPFLILTSVVTNYISINIYGIIGAAIATSITIFLYSAAKYFLVMIKVKLNVFSVNHIYIFINTILVVLIFTIKPRFLENNFLEIGLNATIITLVFVGGNFLMKSSNEMNDLIKMTYKRLLGR
jgi:O-antigen/teichoic acid export membrane protein